MPLWVRSRQAKFAKEKAAREMEKVVKEKEEGGCHPWPLLPPPCPASGTSSDRHLQRVEESGWRRREAAGGPEWVAMGRAPPRCHPVPPSCRPPAPPPAPPAPDATAARPGDEGNFSQPFERLLKQRRAVEKSRQRQREQLKELALHGIKSQQLLRSSSPCASSPTSARKHSAALKSEVFFELTCPLSYVY